MLDPAWRGLSFLLVVSLLTGCLVLPIPTPEHGLLSGSGEIEPAELTELKVGESRREQVLLMLGEPGLSLDDGRFLIYEWSVIRAYVLWAVGMYYSGSGGIESVGKQYVFLVEFDANGVLKRMERQPVSMFESFAASVDAWTPDDATKLVPLSLSNTEVVAPQSEANRWVLDVPTDTIRIELERVPDDEISVRIPAAPTRGNGPHGIGFKTPGNHHPVATVSTADSPDRLVYDSFVNGWRHTRLKVVDAGGISLSWKVRKFEVSSPVTLTSWRAQGTLELDVTMIGPDGQAHEQRIYRTTQTVGTLFGPGPEDYRDVIIKCLTNVATQLGNDLIGLK
jgi:outer membrane protein assembly factor BamE (lipoprotein component of BamABCDE complex)